jgi:hypothetical protein
MQATAVQSTFSPSLTREVTAAASCRQGDGSLVRIASAAKKQASMIGLQAELLNEVVGGDERTHRLGRRQWFLRRA